MLAIVGLSKARNASRPAATVSRLRLAPINVARPRSVLLDIGTRGKCVVASASHHEHLDSGLGPRYIQDAWDITPHSVGESIPLFRTVDNQGSNDTVNLKPKPMKYWNHSKPF